MKKKKNNNNIKIIAGAIPFAAAISLASATDVQAAETTTSTPLIQVQNENGENIEYLEEFMDNDAYRASARNALKDSLVAGRPVLVAEDGEWIKVNDISEGMSILSARITEVSGVSVDPNVNTNITSNTTHNKVEPLEDVNTYSVNSSGAVIDEKGVVMIKSDGTVVGGKSTNSKGSSKSVSANKDDDDYDDLRYDDDDNDDVDDDDLYKG
ncbi:MAG: hypothetical protein ACK5LY_06460 [Lachnospirales bacterium]